MPNIFLNSLRHRLFSAQVDGNWWSPAAKTWPQRLIAWGKNKESQRGPLKYVRIIMITCPKHFILQWYFLSCYRLWTNAFWVSHWCSEPFSWAPGNGKVRALTAKYHQALRGKLCHHLDRLGIYMCVCINIYFFLIIYLFIYIYIRIYVYIYICDSVYLRAAAPCRRPLWGDVENKWWEKT